MPELREDDTTLTVHGLGHCGPAADLGIGEQSGNVVPANGVATDPRALGDDQPGRRALGVIRTCSSVGTKSALVARLRVIGAMTTRLASG